MHDQVHVGRTRGGGGSAEVGPTGVLGSAFNRRIRIPFRLLPVARVEVLAGRGISGDLSRQCPIWFS